MSVCNMEECCPPFDPAPWDERELVWENKRFVKDRVLCFLHIPLNFGAVMKRTVTKIEAAGAKPEAMIVLCDESLWGSDVYLDVTKDVPGASMATISGTFLAKVFEGSFSQMGKWMDAMKAYVKSRDKEPKKIYCYYTTCPKCAKKYGRNYVVLLAQV